MAHQIFAERRSETDAKAGAFASNQTGGKPALEAKNGVFEGVRRDKKELPTVRLELTTAGLQNRCHENVNNCNSNTYDKGKKRLSPSLTPKRAREAENKPQIDPDLQAIIDRWSDLPEHIRKTIKTIAGIERQ